MSQTNMVVTEGRIVKILPGKSEKAPSRVTIRNVDDFNNKFTARYVNWTIFPTCKGFDNLKEGNTVKLIGRILEDNYEKDGKKVYYTSVIANSIEVSDNVLDMPQQEKPAEVVEPEPIADADLSDDEEIPF